MTAEYLADKYAISRKEQDEYALASFLKWEKAEEAGRFNDERISIKVPGRKGQVTVMDWDEHGRKGMTYDKLAKLPTVFRKEGGTIHAGNASGITDAAAAVIVTTREEAERRGWPILARIGAATTTGVDPIGCTGARIVVTLLHEMQKHDSGLGLAALCMSGGMGMAMSFHR